MSFSYRNRGLEQAFNRHATHKVLILEGRRAVGKSSLVRHLQEQGRYNSYRTLSDPMERARAEADPMRWLEGLRALRNNGGLHLGFVVHTGAAMEQLDDDIWALPLSALADPNAWSATPRPTRHEEIITVTTPSPDSPSVFLSYVHDDDTFGGLLVRFAEQVTKAYRTETGTPLELIVDRDTLNWGERWRNRLTTELARATFLLAMVTPSYIRSEVCRQEFLDFRSGEATKAHDGILALLAKDPRWNRTDVVNDPLVAQIRETVSERQWLTLEHPLEELEVDTPQFRRTAQAVAKALAERVDAFDSAPPPEESAAEPSEQGSGDGLLELHERIKDELIPRFTERISECEQAMTNLFQDFTEKLGSLPQGRTPQSSALISITHRLEPKRQPSTRPAGPSRIRGTLWSRP